MDLSVADHPVIEPEAPTGMTTATSVVVLLVAAVLPFVATLGYDFVWDDHLILRQIDRAVADGGLLRMLSQPFLPAPDVPNNFYRPVVYLTYWVDRVVGGGHPAISHADNVLLHAGVTVLVFLFARRLLRDDLAALAAGLVFATHPVHVESVAWVAGRTDILCALFSLGAVLAWLRGLSVPGGRERWIAVACCGLLVLLAVLSKEAAIVLPVLLLLTASAPTIVRGHARPGMPDLTRAWIAAFVPAFLVAFAIRYIALHDELGQVPFLTQVRGTLLLKEPGVALDALVTTLRFLVVPWPHNAMLGRTEVEIGAISVAAVALLGGLAVWAMRRSNFHAGITATVWIVAFSVTSLLKPNEGAIVAAERYAYLASVGAALLLGSLVGPSGLRASRGVRLAVVGMVTLALAGASLGRARVWANEDTLTADLVRTSPQSAWAHQYRGNVLVAAGRAADAIESYRRALAMAPDSSPLLNSLGRSLMKTGDVRGAADAFRGAVKIEPDWAEPHVGLAVACATLGDWTCVAAQRDALRMSPRDLALLDRILRRSSR